MIIILNDTKRKRHGSQIRASIVHSIDGADLQSVPVQVKPLVACLEARIADPRQRLVGKIRASV
jgi:hypothetical protein